MATEFDWNSLPQVDQSPKKTEFDWAAVPKVDGQEKITPVESAARGAAQGLTFGFADEGSGAVEALWNKAKGNPAEFGELYRQYRDESRENFSKAKEANPSAYTAGEVGGSIATAAVPLGSTATLAKAMQTGARLGGLSAFGSSDAEDASGMIKDVFTGTLLGTAGGALGKGVEKIPGAVRSLRRMGADEAVKEGAESAAGALSKESGSIPIDDGISPIRDTAVSVKDRVQSYFNPKVDPKFQEFVEIAKRNDIDPAVLPMSIQFGPDSSASRASRSLAEGRFGEQALKKFNDALDQVRGAYDRKITQYSKGLPTDEVTAGKILRDSYDDGVSRFFDQMDFTYNSIMDQVPGLQITPEAMRKIESSLNGIEKFAKGQAMRGITNTDRGQAEQLLRAVQAVRSGSGSYKQTVEALRGIGKAAFQSANSMADVPVDVRKMRKLYNDVNEAVVDTVRSTLGDDIADSLVSNNKAMSEFFGDQSLISRVMGDKKIAPETAFKSLILSGDTKQIQALKKILPPENWEYLKGAVLENLAKRDPEGNFTFRQLHNTMRSKKSSLSEIFTPQEVAESVDLVRLGDRFGNPVLSTSGTGASISYQDLVKGSANLSVDSFAIANAKRAAARAADGAAEKAAPTMRDVSPSIKDIHVRAGSTLLGSPSDRTNSKVSENEPAGGPERWVLNGISNLQKAGIDQDTLESLKSTAKGRELLIEASDAKPNSKRLEGVLRRIRTSSRTGGE